MDLREAAAALRQRKIVQTLVVYAGVSWGILQVLGFFVDTYQWPRAVIDVTLFVLACGLAAALTLAWFHGEKGRQRVSRAELTILLLLAMVAVLGGWGLARRSGTAAADDDVMPRQGTLAVLPFQNTTGDQSLAWLQQGLAEALSMDLAQVPKLHVVSGQHVFDLLSQEGVATASIVPEPVALKVARKASARYLVRGVVFRPAGRYRIQVELVSADNGVIAAAERREGPDPFPLVDSLAAALSAKILGTSAPDAAPHTAFADLATSSLDAYREYQLAMEAQRNQRGTDAAIHLRRAVELDSTFPQALMHLGIAEMNNSQLQVGLAHLEAARRHLDRASERDRLFVEGVMATTRRDTSTARVRFETLTRRYPDEKDAWMWLDDAYAYQRGSEPRREAVLRQVLRLDPTFAPALNQLAYMYAGRGDTRRSDSILDLYVRAHPREPNPYDTRGEIRERAGRYPEARDDYLMALRVHPNFLMAMDHLVRVAARSGRFDAAIADLAPYTRNSDRAVAAKAFTSTADLLMWKGQAPAALAAYGRARALLRGVEGGEGPRIAILRNMAEIWMAQGRAQVVVDSLAPAIRQGAPTLWPTCGTALASLGRLREAAALRDSLAGMMRHPEIAELSRGSMEAYDAVVAYYSGDWNRALQAYAAVRAARGTPPGQYIGVTEVMTLLNVGRTAEALPLVAGIDTLASNGLGRHIALYVQGRTYEANGRTADAIRAYERLIATWGSNLGQFPKLRDAPDRLARLRRR